MVAASGVRFDGLDFLLVFFMVGTLISAVMWLLSKRVMVNDEQEFELIKKREAAKVGLDQDRVHEKVTSLKPFRFTLMKNGVVVQDGEMMIETQSLGFFPTEGKLHEMWGRPEYGETKPFDPSKIFDWKQSPTFTDWDRDEPACW